MAERDPVVVIGVGNELRGDDAVGLEVARRVGERVPRGVDVREERGELLRLLDTWDGYHAAILIDAMYSGGRPGTVSRLEASGAALGDEIARCTSTHSVALSDVIELARELHRLPPRVIVFAIEGEAFGAGGPLAAPVRAAVPAVAHAVLDECSAVLAGIGPES